MRYFNESSKSLRASFSFSASVVCGNQLLRMRKACAACSLHVCVAPESFVMVIFGAPTTGTGFASGGGAGFGSSPRAGNVVAQAARRTKADAARVRRKAGIGGGLTSALLRSKAQRAGEDNNRHAPAPPWALLGIALAGCRNGN